MRDLVLKRTWAEIDLDRIEENYRQIRACTKKNAMVCCVIKADAYGHGAIKIALELQRLGADYFGVSNLEEALQLRESGIRIPILILGYTPAEHAEILAKADIRQCVYSAEYAKSLSDCAVKSGVTVNCHLKIDTGMNRLGISAGDPAAEPMNRTDSGLIDELLEICSLPSLGFTGIFTHFAVSDDGAEGREFTLAQYRRFIDVAHALEKAGKSFEIRHCANSGAVLDYPETHLDMVRAGIVLYGLYPSAKSSRRTHLEPALSLKSVVAYVKDIHKGDTVSYGRIFTAAADMRIATVPIGYADGYPRILGECGASAVVNGQLCKIAGRVCMDQLMLDVTGVPDVGIGTIVTLIGRDDGAEVTAETLASCEGSINYEVICDIGKRVPRVYIKDGEIESTLNMYAEYFV